MQGIDTALREAAAGAVVPGVAAAAADSRGLLYEGAFGRRSLSADAPVTADSVFWIASMTKALTAAAAMQLVEQGRLQLDAPISAVLPELSRVQVLEGFAGDGAPQLRPPRRPISLRHLLSHTSGFGYAFCNTRLNQYVEKLGVPDIMGCSNAALRVPLLFDPGEQWEYGTGIDWAGKAVEALSGMDIEAYLAKHLLEPLGMRSTAFTLSPALRDRMATMHVRGPDGTLTPIGFEMPQQPEFKMGGGGVYSTAGDYLRFLRMLLNEGKLDGNRVLRAETVRLMRQNQVGGLQAGAIKTAMPQYSNDFDFYPGMPQRWGLSFLINMEQSPQGRNAGSLAWAGLSNSYYWFDPQADVCGVILMQILPFADAGALELFNRFEEGVYRHRTETA
ncbi:MAG: beta-lactamase family protein [Nevskia sp.]|nr:beta-lactamase family protein [Nevskia sp.]